ncbi:MULTISPECIES: hypothetical protein [Aeromonas]|uniref:hypothetical protein n=1 Tax=Aeromonas TaxID=642 RepID=UPI000D690506|nr:MULTISPECIES: hypothetical protein [Aeromonas]
MTKTEMDIRLTKIFSAAAIALATPDKRAVCRQLKQFDREARAQGLFALAGEASQMRWQLVAELQQNRGGKEVQHGHL